MTVSGNTGGFAGDIFPGDFRVIAARNNNEGVLGKAFILI